MAELKIKPYIELPILTSVLYISHTGLLEPLGESQVFQYLRQLAADHRITLLTFEKPKNLADHARLAAMEAKCAEAGIAWHRKVWHSRPAPFATLWDATVGARAATALARDTAADVLHCRSYIGSLMGMMVKRATGAKLIFDMRGFWADERAEAGQWSRSGVIYKAVKRIERALFSNADDIVSRTRAGVREFESFDFLQGRVPPSSVIPTCTDLELFQPRDMGERPFTLGYVGSAGPWYQFDKVTEVAGRILANDPAARFLILNRDEQPTIIAELAGKNIDLDRVELRSCSYREVGEYMARMDAAVFFYLSDWSKCATSPTRLGEFLGCGVPCLTNEGVGDVSENLSRRNAGVLMPVDERGRVDMTGIDDGIARLRELAKDPDTRLRCRRTAEELFSLETGVNEYDRIYRRLAGSGDVSAACAPTHMPKARKIESSGQ